MTDQYVPGTCNIGPAEIAMRRRAGHVGLAATAALAAALLRSDRHPAWRLTLAMPAAGAASGYLQARQRFCANFGFRGVYNFDRRGHERQVTSDQALAEDRRQARQIAAALPPVALLGALELLMSVARTGLPHTNHTPASTQPAPGIAGVTLDRTSSSNGHRHPAELALALPQDRTPGADQDPAAAPDARQQVRALVARERSGGPKVTAAEVVAVTGRSRRRAYELLRDARTEQG